MAIFAARWTCARRVFGVAVLAAGKLGFLLLTTPCSLRFTLVSGYAFDSPDQSSKRRGGSSCRFVSPEISLPLRFQTPSQTPRRGDEEAGAAMVPSRASGVAIILRRVLSGNSRRSGRDLRLYTEQSR